MLIFTTNQEYGEFKAFEFPGSFEEIQILFSHWPDDVPIFVLLPNDWIFDSMMKAHRRGGRGRYLWTFFYTHHPKEAREMWG